MATLTPNYNLSKPEATDPFGDFRDSYNDNMDIIDANMGGGGGDVTDVEVNGVSVLDPDDKIAKITSYEEVNLAEYEAIPAGDRETNGIAYFIKDLNNENVQGYPPLIYSDEEREVGVWRDGKPLYQKTWEFDSSLTVPSNTWTNSPIRVSDFNFENIVSVIGFNADGTFFGFLGANHDQTYVQIIQTRNAQITLKNVTFQYTKTTDTAGSGIWNGQGGIAHHYSENETVVGTWIDGSTLYEKSFDFGAIGANSNKTIDVTALNIDYIPSFVCTALLNNGTIVPIPVSHTVNMSSQHFCRYNTSGTLGIYTGSGQAITQAYMTIQYTKTS